MKMLKLKVGNDGEARGPAEDERSGVRLVEEASERHHH
jgi:hypothetical protein